MAILRGPKSGDTVESRFLSFWECESFFIDIKFSGC